VLARLEYRAGHAEVWRDAINSWVLRFFARQAFQTARSGGGTETTASHCPAGRAITEPSYENLFQNNRVDK
jgi:hypothetical protein